MIEREVFEAALAIADPGQRSSYLDKVCAGDQMLHDHLRGLLEVHDKLGEFLQRPLAAGDITTARSPVPDVGTIIEGRYELLQKIGEGGMGTVFMAEQAHPVKRKVALKFVKPGMDSRQVIARFEAERQALALMDHVNIARVFDGGTTEHGQPYFVMELVHGVPITKYCDANHLTPRERLELFVPVCQAIQHAHQKGIIHRDIKPSNVMVTLYDGKPVPKVIDFGVAKATEQKLTERMLFTQYGTLVGTLEYMSPEQAEMSALGVDTRSDIYSLGVLLYELLTGTTPLSHERMKEAAYAEILRMIKEKEPPKPSTRLSDSGEALASISKLRKMKPAELTKLVRGELDWIVMKCLEKDRHRRYETANGFAADVQRYLADEPVQACPPSMSYRLRKFYRRNKRSVWAAGLVLAAVVAGIGGVTWGMRRDYTAMRSKSEMQVRVLDQLDVIASIDGRQFASLENSPAKQKLLTELLPFYRYVAGDNAEAPEMRFRSARAAYAVGKIELRLGRTAEAEAAFVKANEGYNRLIGEFPNIPESRRELGYVHNSLGLMLLTLGEPVRAEKEFGLALDIRNRLAAEFPTVEDYRHEVAESYINLGILMRRLKKLAEAKTNLRRAVVILASLVGERPMEGEYRHELASGHRTLGDLTSELGSLNEALEHYKESLTLRERLCNEFPANDEYRAYLGADRNNLGNSLDAFGRFKEAEVQYRASLVIRGNLARKYPGAVDYQHELGGTHNNLANALKSLGELDEAEKHYLIALDVHTKLAMDIRNVPELDDWLADTHHNLAVLLRVRDRPQEAEEHCVKALSIREELVNSFPMSDRISDYEHDQAASCFELGVLAKQRADWGKAFDQYTRAVSLEEKLVAQNPNVMEYQVALSSMYYHLAVAARHDRGPSECLPWLDKAIATLQPMMEEQALIDARRLLLDSYQTRADVFDQLKRFPEALSDRDRAVDLSPNDKRRFHRARRAIARLRCDMVAEAVAEVGELTTAVADGPDRGDLFAENWYDFACILAIASVKISNRQEEYVERSMAFLKIAVDQGYDNAAHMEQDMDLVALRERQDFQKLVNRLKTPPSDACEDSDGGKKRVEIEGT